LAGRSPDPQKGPKRAPFGAPSGPKAPKGPQTPSRGNTPGPGPEKARKRAENRAILGPFLAGFGGLGPQKEKQRGKMGGPGRGGAWGPRGAPKGAHFGPLLGPPSGALFWGPGRRPGKAVWGGSGARNPAGRPGKEPKPTPKGGPQGPHNPRSGSFGGPESGGMLRDGVFSLEISGFLTPKDFRAFSAGILG